MDEDIRIEEDEALKNFLPQGFGRSDAGADTAAQMDRARRQVSSTKATTGQKKAEIDSDDEDDSDDDSDDDPEDDFPLSHELVLKTHERAVTSVTADTSGARLVTGSTDCTLKFHDFASMTPNTLRSFKSVEPDADQNSATTDTHPIHHVSFNPNSPAELLVISANPQARIFSRDGEPLVEFVKGDMYLRDMHNTKGHISEITSGSWHPTNRNLCVTAGTDSTLRIWDVNMKRSQKDVLVHKSRAAGSAGRTRITAVAWGSPLQGGTGSLVAAGLDGSLVLWPENGPYTRPAAEIRDAHANNAWTSGIAISPDGRTVVTRGGDDTIKLWDTRKFKTAISTVSHPSLSHYTTANIIYSPSGANILTGSETGHLHILNPATLRAEITTPVTPGSPLITVSWHPKINQIITGSANAETHVLYNPSISEKGAATVMSKAPKRRHIDDNSALTVDQAEGISGDSIVNPHGLLKPASLTKNKDPRRPHIPATTPFAKSQPDEEHIKNSIPLSSMRNEDPREALLKYAEQAEKDPIFTKAWSKTQPNPVFREVSDDEEDEPDKKKARRL